MQLKDYSSVSFPRKLLNSEDVSMYPLDASDCVEVLKLIRNTPSINKARDFWIGRNLSGEIQFLKGNDGKEPLFAEGSYMQQMLSNVFKDFLRDHWEWEMLFGIVPWYKKIDEDTKEVIPKVPPIGTGMIYTGFDYRKNKKKQVFEWIWNDENSGQVYNKENVDKDVKFLLIPNKYPDLFGGLKSPLSTVINHHKTVLFFEKKAKSLEDLKSNPPRVIEQSIPKEENVLKNFKDLIGNNVKLMTNKCFMNAQMLKKGPVLELLKGNKAGTSFLPDGDEKSDIKNTFPGGRDENVPDENESGDRFIFNNGIGRFISKSGDPREFILAPFQDYKSIPIGKERNDLLGLMERFEEYLGESINHPTVMLKGKNNHMSSISLHSVQSEITTSLNMRIDLYQKHAKKVFVELYGDELKEQRNRVLNDFNKRMKELENKAEEHKLTNTVKKKRKLREFQMDEFIKILPIADSFLDIRVILPTASKNIILDYNTLDKAYSQGWLDDKVYSNALENLFGLPVNKKKRIMKEDVAAEDKKVPELSKDSKSIKIPESNKSKTNKKE